MQSVRHSAFLLAALALDGCAGSGVGTGPAKAATSYIVDPAFSPISMQGFSDVLPSGVSPGGEFMCFGTDNNSGDSGYFTAGQFTAFPFSNVSGATGGSVEAAGGTTVWAAFATATSAIGTAILDLSSQSVVTVANVELANEAAASPDGTKAFVEVVDTNDNPTGAVELLGNDGKAIYSITPGGSFVPNGVSNTGWTVGIDYASPAHARRHSSRPGTQSVMRASGQSVVLVSPKGKITTLSGTNPQPWGVNDQGIAVGFDVRSDGSDEAVRWDTSGKETVLQSLAAGNGEVAFGINHEGLIVGTSTPPQGSDIPVIWQSDGTVIDLSSRITKLQGMSFVDPAEISDGGKIIGFGTDASNNGALFVLTPAKA